MDLTILIFLGVALVILALAIIIPRLFRKTIDRDRQHEDLNRDHHDATDHAAWIGIRKSGGDDPFH